VAINVLRGLRNRTAGVPAAPADTAARAESIDSFDDYDHPAKDAPRGPKVACPACGRDLGLLQIECPGCGLRILAGVPIKRGALLVVAGCAGGLILGSILAVAMALTSGSSHAAAGAGSVASPAAGASIDPSADPALVSGPVAQSAAAALRLTANVQDRLAASSASLKKQLKGGFSGATSATTFRQIAADSAWGSDVVDRLAGWPAAAPLRAQLSGTYDTLRAAAREALNVSLRDNAKYKASAKKMVKLLGSTEALRKAIEALGAANAITIPVPATAP
jgi:hypothetical protein